MAQPPLSQQIRKLEQDLGVQLFQRTSRRVELTEEGQVLLDAARNVLAEADHLRTLAGALRLGEAGHIEIGFVASILNWGLTPALRVLREQYPAAHVSATQMAVADQVEAVLDNRIDIGFTMARLNYDKLDVTPLAEEPLRLVLPVDHPRAGEGPVALADFAQESIVGYRAPFGEHLEDFISRACHQAGFTPKLVFQGAQTHTIVHMVAAGFGVALVPACDERIGADGVVFTELAPPTPTVVFSAITHRWRKTPLTVKLLEIVSNPLVRPGA